MHGVTLEPLAAARFHQRFHLWMAGVFAALAFTGFIPSYWSKLAAGTFAGTPMIHLHGALFFTWTGFYFMQAALIATGRTSNHRAWGMFGVAVFSVMLCTTAAVGIHSIRMAEQLGFGDAGRQFSIATFSGIALLAGFFVTAIANVRSPETHKRLMFLVMTLLMQPVVGRLLALLLAPEGAIGPPPLLSTIVSGLATDTLILVAIFHDRRTRGRPHGAYIWGGAIILAVQILRIPLGYSAAWMSFARLLEGFGT